jgi:hypothetical protein
MNLDETTSTNKTIEHLSIEQRLVRIRSLCETPHWSSDHSNRRNRIQELAEGGLIVLESLKRKGISTGEESLEPARAEFSDTAEGFKFRLTWNGEASKWYSHYEGVLVHTFSDGRKWALCSGYWSGAPDSSMPVETPFEIVEGASRLTVTSEGKSV